MAIDQWGRWAPDYNNPNNNYQSYRDELQRQKEAIEYRLSDFDRRYQIQPQPIQKMPNNSPNIIESPAPVKPTQPYIIVTSEKEARDYPIVNRIDDEIGRVHFFVMNDESALFAKRINPSTFEMEFQVYILRNDSENVETTINANGDLLVNIDARLQKIEQFVDGVFSTFINGNIMKNSSDPAPVKQTAPKQATKQSSPIILSTTNLNKSESEVE